MGKGREERREGGSVRQYRSRLGGSDLLNLRQSRMGRREVITRAMKGSQNVECVSKGRVETEASWWFKERLAKHEG